MVCELSLCDIVKFFVGSRIRNVAQDFLNSAQKSNFKDSALALKKKEEGNEKYKKNEFEESLSLYTESIFYAAKNDECLPLVYSNRSLVLERLGYVSESLADIDMSLSCGYPKQKVGNLILRKTRCLLKLGDVEKAREILTEALKSVKEKEYQRVIKNELEKIKDEECTEPSDSEVKLPDLVGGENENFVFASKHLSVHYDKKRGRHVIANKDIKAGDVLLVEKPFAFITFDKFCSNCYKESIAPIPCWTCTSEYYCSPECRDNFWSAIHSFECGFTELFKSFGIAHLSFRVTLKASNSLIELKRILKNISEPDYRNGSIISISTGYEAVFNLVQNFEYYEAKEMSNYIVTAFSIALYLKNYTNYFPMESDDEDLNLLTSVILRHILQLICNGFCITTPKKVQKLAVKETGVAVYTSASMINHSCEPSALHGFYGNYIIIRARKAIKEGEEVFISYGPNIKTMREKSKRQEILSKQYFFKCECKPCLQRFNFQDKFWAFKCEECKGPSVRIEENSLDTVCLSCGQNSRISLDVSQKYNKFYSLMSEGDVLFNEGKSVTLPLKKYLEAWRIGRMIFYKFHEDVTRAANSVARCLLNLREFKKCISFLKCCIRQVEAKFGISGLELAFEMKKLADIISAYVIHNEKAKDAKDLGCEALLYYRKVQKIISFFPELNGFEDLEINLEIIKMILKKF